MSIVIRRCNGLEFIFHASHISMTRDHGNEVLSACLDHHRATLCAPQQLWRSNRPPQLRQGVALEVKVQTCLVSFSSIILACQHLAMALTEMFAFHLHILTNQV